MSLSNMVATQGSIGSRSVKIEDMKTQLVSLQLSGKRVVNRADWESAVRTVFSTYALSGFLVQSSSYQVPDDQFVDLMVEQMVEERISSMQSAVVKQENSTSEVDQDRLNLLRENCKSIAEEQMKAILASSKVGKRETLFVDAATAVDSDKTSRSRNPRATVRIEHLSGRVRNYELESQLMRVRRMQAYNAILGTLNVLDNAVYKNVATGDVFGLYAAVVSHLSRQNEVQLTKAELQDELEESAKLKEELFLRVQCQDAFLD